MQAIGEALAILLIEPEQDSAESMATLLELNGFGVRTVPNGEAALRESAYAPDVVILELRLPGVDGWEVARRFAACEKPPLLIAVTTCSEPAEVRRSYEAGIHLHLVKPCEPAAVVRTLRRFADVVSPAVEPSAIVG